MADMCSAGGSTCRGVYCRGMCRFHYARWLAHGDPTIALRPARHGTVPRYNTGCRCEKCAAIAIDSLRPNASEHAKQWRAANKARARVVKERWEVAHPEAVRLSAWATEQRRRGLPPNEDDVAYAKILLGDMCSYCGGIAGQIDHIAAQTCGGGGGWDNLTAACGRCNSQKHTKTLLHFMLDRVD